MEKKYAEDKINSKYYNYVFHSSYILHWELECVTYAIKETSGINNNIYLTEILFNCEVQLMVSCDRIPYTHMTTFINSSSSALNLTGLFLSPFTDNQGLLLFFGKFVQLKIYRDHKSKIDVVFKVFYLSIKQKLKTCIDQYVFEVKYC